MRDTSGSEKPSREKSKKRHDFSPATREHLAKAAGYRCSRHRCLVLSTCISEKHGNTVSANLGVASHIYAASENGPRPAPPEMTPEQIEHVSNGIWTCRECGGLIDVRESKFSAESLLQMKRVRELAQEMAVCDPDVKRVTGYITPLDFDQVFWDHLPGLDPERIKFTLMRLGAEKMIEQYGLSSDRLPTPPGQLALTPMARAIRAATPPAPAQPTSDALVVLKAPGQSRPSVEEPHGGERSRATDIANAWTEYMLLQRERRGIHRYFNHCYVKLAARDPATSAVSEAFIWARGNGYVEYAASAPGELRSLGVTSLESQMSNLDWHLKIDLQNGACQIASTLRLSPRSRCVRSTMRSYGMSSKRTNR